MSSRAAAARGPFAQHAAHARSKQLQHLARRYHDHGDLAAREELIRQFLPLARQLARRASRQQSFDDLYQVASAAVVKGIDRYDPDHGAALSSYLVPTILGEIKRNFRDVHWGLRIPRDMHDRMVAARAVGNTLWQELGRAPTPAELAAELGITTEQVLEMHEADTALAVRSLDMPLGEEDGDDLGSSLGRDDDGFDAVHDRSVLAAGLRTLTERERLILKLRFEDDLPQREIGEQLGISQMHVSRLIRRALDRLRAVAEA